MKITWQGSKKERIFDKESQKNNRFCGFRVERVDFRDIMV